MKIPCDNCGKTFDKCRSHALRAKRNFCSKECWKNHDPTINKDFFSVIDTQEKAYWLGMICADGWLDARDKCVALALKRQDREHVKQFAKLFGASVHDYDSKTSKYSRCVVYSKTAFRDLIAKGVTPKKSLKDNCEVFNHVPENLISHFVRGWFDGDGSIGHVFSITGTEKALHQLLEKITNHTNVTTRRLYKCKRIWNIRIGGRFQLTRIKRWLYADSTIALQRKVKVWESKKLE